jgi:uncharacterized membrane protein
MRGYQSYNTRRPVIEMPERIFAALTYLTSGLIGFIWLVVSHLQHRSLSGFAKYNIFQSLLLSILIYVAGILLNIVVSIASIIPFFGALVINIVYYFSQMPLLFNRSLIELAIFATYIYLAVFAFNGKCGRLPYISDMVRQMG